MYRCHHRVCSAPIRPPIYSLCVVVGLLHHNQHPAAPPSSALSWPPNQSNASALETTPRFKKVRRDRDCDRPAVRPVRRASPATACSCIVEWCIILRLIILRLIIHHKLSAHNMFHINYVVNSLTTHPTMQSRSAAEDAHPHGQDCRRCGRWRQLVLALFLVWPSSSPAPPIAPRPPLVAPR